MSQLSQTAIDKLYEIQRSNPPKMASIPYAEDYIEVDWRTRSIGERDILSTARDHKSENLYFIMDRYWDYMDLSTTTCVISYKTYPADPQKQGVTGLYAVPYYDIYTHKATPGTLEKDKMIIPWCLDASVAEKEGSVKFFIRFFKVDKSGEEPQLIYNLSTLPAKSMVLESMKIEELDSSWVITTDQYDNVLSSIDNLSKQLSEVTQLKWVPAKRL